MNKRIVLNALRFELDIIESEIDNIKYSTGVYWGYHPDWKKKRRNRLTVLRNRKAKLVKAISVIKLNDIVRFTK